MLGRSWTVLRVRGIPVRLHITLLLFLPYVALIASAQFREMAAAVGVRPESLHLPPLVWGAVLAVALFAGILLHELAHSLVALRQGVKVRSITLMMLGGVSMMEGDVPPHREAWMAFSGPLTSFGIAVASYIGYRLTAGWADLHVALMVFAVINLVLAAFNLLPAFPMDGGRVLRGLLSRRLGHLRATRIATRIGKGMAVAFGLLGLLSFNLILLLIAVFIYMGASGESVRLEANAALRGVPIAQLMNDRVGDAGANERVSDVALRLLRENHVACRVREDGAGPPGMLTALDLGRPAARAVRDARAREAMRTDLPRLRPEEDATRGLEALQSGSASAVLVVDERDEVIGIVTQQEIARAIALVGLIDPRAEGGRAS